MSTADLTPEQIAAALAELARRDQVAIWVNTHKGQPCHFQVVEARIIEGAAFAVEHRSGTGSTYAAALSACRAAEFTGGKSK